MTDDQWAKAIIMHLTGQPDDPTPMLLKMIADIRGNVSDQQINKMVERFLAWRLPRDFNPDCGISARRPNYAPGVPWEPVGTNLLTATQADAMVRHMLGRAPIEPENPGAQT